MSNPIPPGIRCGDGCDAPEKSGLQNRICSDVPSRCRPMIHLTTMWLSRRPEPRLAVTLLTASLTQSVVMAQSRTRIHVSKLGPQIGERVREFTLKDQNGKPWTLQSIMGPKGAMLVFYRSADW